MYYNYTDEQKHFLSVTDAMLKDDFSVEEIVEFWQSEDQDQVEGILASLTLTESVDFSNPDLAVVCERFGLGWISRGAQRLWRGLRGINPKTGKPRITQGAGVADDLAKSNPTLRNKAGRVVQGAKDKVKSAPKGVKGAAAIAAGSGALLYTQGELKGIQGDGQQQQPKDTTKDTTPKEKPGVELAPGANASVEPKKSYGWWKKYPKMDDYSSSRQYYRNIFAK